MTQVYQDMSVYHSKHHCCREYANPASNEMYCGISTFIVTSEPTLVCEATVSIGEPIKCPLIPQSCQREIRSQSELSDLSSINIRRTYTTVGCNTIFFGLPDQFGISRHLTPTVRQSH